MEYYYQIAPKYELIKEEDGVTRWISKSEEYGLEKVSGQFGCFDADRAKMISELDELPIGCSNHEAFKCPLKELKDGKLETVAKSMRDEQKPCAITQSGNWIVVIMH